MENKSHKGRRLVIQENIQFNHIDIHQYKEMFIKLEVQGKIVGKFEDSTWRVPYKLTDYPIEFNFDIEIYKDLNEALKAFTLMNIANNIATISFYNDVVYIKKMILKTFGLTDMRNLELLFEELKANFKNEVYRYASSLKRFLNFYQVSNLKEISTIYKKFERGNTKSQRALPNFDDVMTFDYIVNDYFQNNPNEETLKYLPIMVWWTLTNILPLRPSEFLMLKKNCLSKENNSLESGYIVFPRIKNKTNTLEYDTVEIDINAYNFLKRTINLVNTIDPESEDLFPVSLIHRYQHKKGAKPKKNSRINLRDFGTLKEYFYKEIVEEKYGYYNLENIKTGDTRHFAIINMALQGFNMLSIARMAGHDDIQTQSTYYSHAEHFAQSYVYKLAQFKFENNINLNMNPGITGWKRYIYEKSKITEGYYYKEEIVGRIDYGLCTDSKSQFPKNCIESCKYCDKYVFSPTINERDQALAWLTDTSKELENKIHESIELMRDLSNTISSQFKAANYELLKNTSKRLELYMNQKVNIEALLMEAKKHGH